MKPMLKSLFGKKKENDADIPESWAIYFSRIEDKPASIRLNLALNDIAPVKDYRCLIVFTVNMCAPSENGFPTREEFETLNNIEDETAAAIEGKEAIIAAVVKSNGLFDTYIYVRSAKGYEELLSKVMKAHPEYSFTTEVTEDNDWKTYFDFLYPNDYEMQTIQNQKVIANLQQHGDNSEKEREVDHWLYFPAEDNREQFIRKVEAMGYKVLSKTISEGNKDYPYQLNISRQDNTEWSNVNEYVWELVTLAGDNGGIYDGWGCIIVK